MKSIFRKWMSGLLLVATAGLGGCSDDPDGVNNELVLDRALMPLNVMASVLSTGNQVRLTWDVRTTDTYEVVIYSDEGLTEEVQTLSGITPEDVPVTFDLQAEQEYYATVQAFSSNERTAPSNVAVVGPVTTYAVMSLLNPVVEARTSTSVTLTWDQEQYVSHLLAVPVSDVSAEEVRKDLSGEEVEAARATIEGLKPSTEYLVSVYYNSASRGGQDVWTRPDMQNMTTISTVDQLMQAFVDGGKYELAYSETPYVVPEYAEGQTNPASALAADLTIIGETTLEGARPQIVGLGIGLNPGVSIIHLEDLSIDGADAASSLMEVKNTITMTSVTVKNCDLKSFRNIFYENKAGSAIQTLLFDGVYAVDMGNSGGDFIDFRTQSTHGSLTVCNSTFYNGARSFLRVDANETFSSIAVRNNIFGSFSVVTDGNNKGILYVRGTASTFEYTNNLFLNETGENARFIANNNSVKLPTSIAANYFYNCADTFFEAKTADGEVTLATAIQNGGKVLTEDPCENSARGKFYLTNDEIASARVGDPRWWNAVAPVVPEQTELIPITEATVWNFADTETFEAQDITQNRILGNLQFLVNNADAPMAVTSGGTISFSEASTFSVLDVPTNNALAFKVSVPGSVLITPADAGYNKHMEIIVNGSRYALPADGSQSKFGFGDIQGETMIYICSCSPVELQALEWSLEVVSGGEPKVLETPVFTTSELPSLDQGTSQAVTVSWNAVPSAAAYEVTFNGKTETVESPSYEISAATVASLKAGSYPLTVVAKAAEGSLNWTDSEAASITLKINEVLTTVSTAWTWDIADAVTFPAGDIKENTIYGNLQFLATSSKHITIEHSTDSDTGEPVNRIKFNGKSTMDGVTPKERGLALRVSGNGTLTVKAISSSSSDASREVGVSANGKEYLREACPAKSDGDAKKVTFTDLTGETTIYIYCYATINIYALSWEPDSSSVPDVQPYSLALNYDLIKNKVGEEIQILTGTAMDGSSSADALEKFSTSSSTPFIQTWTYQGVTFGSAMAAASSSMYMKKGLAIETYLKNETSLGSISAVYLKIVDGSKTPTVNISDDGSAFTALEIPGAAEADGTYAGYFKYDTGGKPYFKITIGGGDAKVVEAVIVGEK